MKKPAAGGQSAVASPPQHAKVHRSQHGTVQMAGTSGAPAGGKAAPTAKHNRKPAKHQATRKHQKKRGLAAGSWAPVCAAEALAMSLRLAGASVADNQVLALWERTPGADESGASILATLEAAARFGLAGARPGISTARQLVPQEVQRPHEPWRLSPDTGRPVVAVEVGPPAEVGARAAGVALMPDEDPPSVAARLVAAVASPVDVAGHGLILGLDLPGPHCVLATPDGWWSWGELREPWPATVEEAWWVAWQ